MRSLQLEVEVIWFEGQFAYQLAVVSKLQVNVNVWIRY